MLRSQASPVVKTEARLLLVVHLLAAICALPAPAAERELNDDTAPGSASEIESPIERVLPKEEERAPPLFPGLRQRLQNLPPFLADSQIEARFRTYYLRKDRTDDTLSEAWAIGGSLSYRSGWLEDLFAVEVEGFTSQPLYAPDERGGTLLLAPGQEGYSVLGIANAKLRYKGVVLTGYRQYLELPYFNKNDSRMTPNTFEAITLAKPEGELRFSAGYAWKVKLRTSDTFESMTEAIGLDEDRGFAHAGAIWSPREDVEIGAIGGVLPDVSAGLYSELSATHELANGVDLRLDGQFTHQWEIGDDLLGDELDDTWNLGVRTSASYAQAVLRLGVSITSPNAAIFTAWGTNPSYVDLMQRAFTRADEKALLVSLSYDFAELGVDGLSVIANFVAGFDAKVEDGRRDAHEIDLTIDYRRKKGWTKNLWLRLRGSLLKEESIGRVGTDIRAIVRYDFPVI